MDFVIAAVLPLGAGIREFHLRRTDGAPPPDWRPGSHIVLSFASGTGRRFANRYSLVGAPGTAGMYRIAVQREERGNGGSKCLHEELGPGSPVGVEGPFDDFPLAPVPAGRAILVAGGIGITPLVSMAHALHAAGKPFALHYLAGRRDRLVLLEELAALGGSLSPHVSEEAGRVDLAGLLAPWQPGDACHACGPAPLLQALAAAAEALGWPADALRVESFGRRPLPEDAPLTVELALSGTTVDVPPGGSILDALIAADAFVSWDCKRGECGNCYTRVLDGTPLHRDVCLTPAMRAEGMCTCVSWAAPPGRLRLEL